MGLKWFRARLSLNKKGAYKVPTMTGMYRRISYSESNTLATRKNEYTFSAVSSSIANDSTSVNDKEQQYDRTKEDLASQLSSLNTDLKRDNYVIQNEGYTASMNDLNAAEQSSICGGEINKINEDQNYVTNTKDRFCQETELVI